MLKGKRKSTRPLSRKHAHHFIFKSNKATGRQSFLVYGNNRYIRFKLKSLSKKFGVRVYNVANAGNHLHIVLKPHSRELLVKFLKSFTGLIARHCMKAERGHAAETQFWAARPFSRIIRWGRDFAGIQKYLVKNRIEAIGFVSNDKIVLDYLLTG